MEGPGVNLLQVHFFLSWYFAGGNNEFGKLDDYFKTQHQTKGNGIVAIAASGPGSEAPYIMETILLALGQAKATIRICTPYFIPPAELTC